MAYEDVKKWPVGIQDTKGLVRKGGVHMTEVREEILVRRVPPWVFPDCFVYVCK